MSWISFDGDAYWVRLSAAQGWPRSIRVTQSDVDGVKELETRADHVGHLHPKSRTAASLTGLTEQVCAKDVIRGPFDDQILHHLRRVASEFVRSPCVIYAINTGDLGNRVVPSGAER